jgi:hypothetical protein
MLTDGAAHGVPLLVWSVTALRPWGLAPPPGPLLRKRRPTPTYAGVLAATIKLTHYRYEGYWPGLTPCGRI